MAWHQLSNTAYNVRNCSVMTFPIRPSRSYPIFRIRHGRLSISIARRRADRRLGEA